MASNRKHLEKFVGDTHGVLAWPEGPNLHVCEKFIRVSLADLTALRGVSPKSMRFV